MSVDLHFSGNDWADVAAQMRSALGNSVVSEQTGAAAKLAEPNEYERAPARARAKKDEPKAAEAPAVEEPKVDAKDEAKSDIPPEGLDYERDIKPSVLEIAGRFGRDKVMEVLAKYGVTNAGHVPVEDQAALMDDINAVLAG